MATSASLGRFVSKVVPRRASERPLSEREKEAARQGPPPDCRVGRPRPSVARAVVAAAFCDHRKKGRRARPSEDGGQERGAGEDRGQKLHFAGLRLVDLVSHVHQQRADRNLPTAKTEEADKK